MNKKEMLARQVLNRIVGIDNSWDNLQCSCGFHAQCNADMREHIKTGHHKIHFPRGK